MKTRDFLNGLSMRSGEQALRALDCLRELDGFEGHIKWGNQPREMVLHVLTIENPRGWDGCFDSNVRAGAHVVAFPCLSGEQAAERAWRLWEDLSDDSQSMQEDELKRAILETGHVHMASSGAPVEIELERTSVTL